MALPTVKSLMDCSDFSHTVAPYTYQLYELPRKLLANYSNGSELLNIYLATNPLIFAFAFSLFLQPFFLVISEANKNYSQVDRCWSILPTLYNVHFAVYAHLAGIPTQRMDNLIAFSTVWSIRLTFNYWRKGGYQIGSEDYRWNILKDYVGGPVFFLFNVVFISLLQSILLFAIATPSYVLLLVSQIDGKMETSDIIYTRVLMGLVLLEYFADQQQWNFQEAKKLYQKTAKAPPKFDHEDLDRGFIVTGLWSWSRHPNFAAEQAVWVILYQWGCYRSNVIYNWTAIGAIPYLLLFQASTWLTELLSSGKYPEYKEYQQRVGKFLPRLSTSLPGDFSDQKGQKEDDQSTTKPPAATKG